MKRSREEEETKGRGKEVARDSGRRLTRSLSLSSSCCLQCEGAGFEFGREGATRSLRLTGCEGASANASAMAAFVRGRSSHSAQAGQNRVECHAMG